MAAATTITAERWLAVRDAVAMTLKLPGQRDTTNAARIAQAEALLRAGWVDVEAVAAHLYPALPAGASLEGDVEPDEEAQG